jgi:hypothetical protein
LKAVCPEEQLSVPADTVQSNNSDTGQQYWCATAQILNDRFDTIFELYFMKSKTWMKGCQQLLRAIAAQVNQWIKIFDK